MSIEVNLDPDDDNGQKLMVQGLDVTANATAPVLRSFLVEFGTSPTNKGATFSFIGIVTDFSVKGAMDAAVNASIKIKVSGAVTFTDVD